MLFLNIHWIVLKTFLMLSSDKMVRNLTIKTYPRSQPLFQFHLYLIFVEFLGVKQFKSYLNFKNLRKMYIARSVKI